MLKSARASFPTWLLNVRDLTHLMSFSSLWKFFPESLPGLLICHLKEREWGSGCTWTLALWARDCDPVCQKHPLLSSLHGAPAGSCPPPPRPTRVSEWSRQEGGGWLFWSEAIIVNRMPGDLCIYTSSLLLSSAFQPPHSSYKKQSFLVLTIE